MTDNNIDAIGHMFTRNDLRCDPERQFCANFSKVPRLLLKNGSAGGDHMLRPIALSAVVASLVACVGGCAVAPGYGYGYDGYGEPYATNYDEPYYYGYPAVYGGGIYVGGGGWYGGRYYNRGVDWRGWNHGYGYRGGWGHGGGYGYGGGGYGHGGGGGGQWQGRSGGGHAGGRG